MIKKIKYFFLKNKIKKILKNINFKESELKKINLYILNNLKGQTFFDQIEIGLKNGCILYFYETTKKLQKTKLQELAEILSVFGIYLIIKYKNLFVKIYENKITVINTETPFKDREIQIKTNKLSFIFNTEMNNPALISLIKFKKLDILITDEKNEKKCKDLANNDIIYIFNKDKIIFPDIINENSIKLKKILKIETKNLKKLQKNFSNTNEDLLNSILKYL
ncbi:hypothetical protein OSSY52_21660 [Tepiditoga spiralis]|uniref:Uncharacterized protein n=1 Tax=Tepiditoga spiralis TaxID=2108365 RepID=A0A7G1G739_9BACT|nr:hypothetical protein [Tepiditoga spiralis]BBE32025.1 hypothetical protein OSSY52_21660 [Tepiditoga spiralis]